MADSPHNPTLGLRLDRDTEVPLFRQISQGIRQAIMAGELGGGLRLPPERLLARALGVNRSTVLSAYRELKDDGLVEGHVGRGTRVMPRSAAASPQQLSPWQPTPGPHLAAISDPLIRDLLDPEHRDTISLALGVPAPDLLPMDLLAEVLARLPAEVGPELALHSPTEGVPALRQAVAGYLEGRGIPCVPREVLVTAGSQQGLDLVARVFLAAEDTVLVEEPTYLGALQVFRRAGARFVTVPVDEEGLRVDLLEPILARVRPRLLYTQPTFQNPTGALMSLPRRRRLLDLACQHRLPILEEDVYGDMRYAGPALPALRALDPTGQVLYVGSFSKTLCPGLRVGWLNGPAAAIRQLAVARQTVDMHTATMNQWVVQRFLAEGLLARHVERIRPQYALRRDTLLEALQPLARQGLTWTRPEGGYYVWCRLPDDVSLPRLAAEAAREGVAFLPGTVCSADGSTTRHVRLNFTALPPERLREGVARLSRALEAARSRNREPAAVGDIHQPLV